ncbi:MAG: Cys-tRNA(Pro) deacylase [Nakamurella sp.]
MVWQARVMVSAPTPAIAALNRAKIAYTLHPYTHDPTATAFGDEAVVTLGLDPRRVFKTLIAEVDGSRLAVGVVPVSGHLNLKALASAVGGKKAAMAAVADAERSSGYVHGGISPLGQRKALPTVIDSSAQEFDLIYVSAGKRGLQMELAPGDLAKVARATFADIAADGHA